MEDRLKGLRKSMKQTTFKQLDFSDQLRKRVHEKITQSHEREEDILLAVLQLLGSEKTGYDLSQLLRGRGIQSFDRNEGALYTLLHRLEQDHLIHSGWDHDGAKYYQLTNKGKKVLQKSEKAAGNKQFGLKELTQE
ncbi:PadR family transcriptional regulator [Jeotgalibacillus terrae]|uniref:PadR family transcriptional regulator n=1 Tax=Jeotgalibacillus terrae TaxID=587735 RepID=A0ABW5ZGT9_9BACL|nr:PadR family transcriptional regulator [Jeotgalibacillus terrae]MBM7578581.1 DNA-binding PadR family transcriptional regulator [Jeotgalibacillus terrae]